MRIFVLFFLLFVLISCGGNNDSSVQFESANTVIFEGSGFIMNIPEKWITSETFEGIPTTGNGKIVMGSVSPQKKYNFSNNIVILEDDLSVIGSSKQYSEKNNAQTKKKYQEYSLVESSDIIFPDSDNSKYYIFDAKYNSQTPKMRFIQTAKMCGTRVYLIHSSVLRDTKTSDYINLFKTFQCK